MEGIYEIKLGDMPVGQAEVTREGLYYRFRCRCQLEDHSVWRVCVGDFSLGILVPEGDAFVLNTKLPLKRFGTGNADFTILTNRPVLKGKFIPIKPEEPFAYIARLKNAYLVRQEGQIGVMIKEKAGT